MSETYLHYRRARDLAWLVLIENNLTEFPLDIFGLIQSYGIHCKPFSKVKTFLENNKVNHNAWAFSQKLNGVIYIAYNDNNSTEQQIRFTLAHELGHVLTGLTNEYSELYGNVFARDLLMPAIVCKIENLTSPQQIADFFNVSIEAANIRANRITELLKRDKWLTAPLEKQYYDIYCNKENKT